MLKVQIGSSRLFTLPVGFGTMHFGVSVDANQAFSLLDRFVDLGGSFVDTANIYSKGNKNGSFHERGQSEQIIGQWLQRSSRRQNVILATKVLNDMGDGYPGLSRRSIHHQIDRSLERLKTDYVDLYQIHGFDENIPIEETLEALTEVVQLGKARYIGCSNLHLSQIREFQTLAESKNYSSLVSYQNSFNLLLKHRLNNSAGSFLLSREECKELGVTLLGYRTLVHGFLAGKFEKGKEYAMDSEGLKAVARHCFNDNGWALLDRLKEIGAKHAATPLQATLAFYRQDSRVGISLIGFSKKEQLLEAMKSQDVHMNQDEWDSIDLASKKFAV